MSDPQSDGTDGTGGPQDPAAPASREAGEGRDGRDGREGMHTMDGPDTSAPAAPSRTERLRTVLRWGTDSRSGLGWRLVVPLVFAMAGFLFFTSAEASDGFDLRPQRPATLAELVETQSNQVSRLQDRAGALEDEINRLTGQVGATAINRLQTKADRLREPAGMGEVHGSALQVTLDDAPDDQPVPEGFDANAMVVHQQDLQAVVNALWAGGARGITLQNQRLISTTGIKCVGNTVVLQGVPYSPPYRIMAVGDPAALQAALDRSDYVQTYLQYTQPPINIGWDVNLRSDVTLQGYQGALNLNYAEPPGTPSGSLG